MITAEEFVKEKGHLPEYLRDHGRQGWLFRWIDQAVQKQKGKEPGDHILNKMPDCIAAHVYVIDFFLWYMGQFGYTLQRSRHKGVQFYDLEGSMEEFEKAEREHFWESLKRDMEKRGGS